ncbi:MAG: anhydro-N-acetylmuramic acid kinase [Flavobacteriaceae bacterium]|nr:anhydro-N-acetylmuramic acid kinase [Flavobacteriaceae bacterium]
MTQKIYRAIGVMSGTSLDGIDLAYVKFISNKVYEFEILEAETLKYSEYWKETLQTAFTKNKGNYSDLSVEYGHYLGHKIKAFTEKNNIQNIDFVASHGHTIFHRPERGFTLQIGDGKSIAKITGHKVICDFRSQDVKLGGQGAPLVPVGDALLFSDYDYCLNLGGFSNISFNETGIRKAYDICPVNIVLNALVKPLGLDYDDGGKLAAKGQLNKQLLSDLNGLNFYNSTNPKSLGYEFVVEVINPILKAYKLPVVDLLRTFTEHIAQQIASKLQTKGQVLVTGGGAYNTYLITRLKALCECKIIIPSNKIIDFKEALIFAFLGLRRLENKVNCLKSVTGASKDHVSGEVWG